MKHWIKRIGAILLTLAMFATMLPATVSAAETLSTSVTGLTASWKYTAQKGGSATWISGGTTISATSIGTAMQTNTATLTLTNNLGSEAVLSFNYSLTTGGTSAATRAELTGAIAVSNQASASGSFSATLADGESVVIDLRSPRNKTATATFTLSDIALISTTAEDPTLTFKPATEGGNYTVDNVAITAETVMEVAINTALALHATAEDGYVFYGWYDELNDKYLSQDAAFNLAASADASIVPVFIPDSVALFGVGSAKYDDLSAAAAAAAVSSTHKTVVLLNDGTITGSHTIPAGVTLLIPYDDANTAHGANAVCTSSDNNSVAWVKPTAYRTLTMAADASITVNGALEVGGRHSSAGGAGSPSAPTGPLGFIYMTAGSHIQVNEGGNLYAWGYIYGDGTVNAKDGAGVYEIFQVMDFRGGNATLAMAADLLVFPMTQYYVQNIEVATTYEYGSTAFVTTSMFVSSQCITAPAIRFIGGAGAMFQPGEGAYVVKKYNPAEDVLELEAYGDCSLSSMKVELAGNAVDTTNFVLPITNNIHITIKSGTATMNQDIAMLPGSSLTVDEGAVLEIPYVDSSSTAVTAGGYVLQLYDSINWTTALDMNTYEQADDLNFVHGGKGFVPIRYSPSEYKIRTAADLVDAVLDINGTVVTDGFLYSTVLWADALGEDFTIVDGGANVISSKGTGKLAMNNGAGHDMLTYMYDQAKDDAFKKAPDYDPESGGTLYYMIPLASVQLQNGNGSLLDTTGAEPGTLYEYCQKHDHWYTGECTIPDAVEITWVVEGESIISEVDFGTVPVYPAGTPAKNLDNNYHYVFAGWSNSQSGAVIDLPVAEGAATYYAVFTAVEHTYGTTAEAGKHYCECGKPASCSEADNDGDHLCDLGCGDMKSEHKGGSASCDKQAVCIECKQGYGPTLDHTYDDEYDADCNVCGDIREVETPVEIAYGDANGDGDVTVRDVALLQQYLAGWDTTLNETAADANGDGDITVRDVALLQQYLAGWDVTLGK